MEEIAGVAIADLGLSGLLTLAVLLILAGGLIPRTLHRTIVAIQQQRIDKLEELLGKRDSQLDRLISGAEKSADALEKIQVSTDPERDGDG
ncbi:MULTISPECIES: hypothetical protein [Rhodococcus]|uniref:hypothetical protein n=1 Tax=Rhodococcus TaxID=1827 RepID=UPI00143E1E4A|nr:MULTISPECIES: hypothetical protein [Rhodococcus]QIX48948.1 hypothetical protein HFP48_04840 [Rhodococcus sp. DMU1]QRI76001.1 hypothetical protein JQ505_26590 [Rhodococcus aetherivorans]QSE59412.1 hypothetical protein JYA75_27690 [Rhodococcus sp. PSBB066]QSE69263.1 hypothetical protein JYA91_27765 [Rhodococcus sp. PSBB049]USC16235.1 hypothetical protein KZJ41_04750 [Rhodococcus sp. 11-3]